MANIRLVQLHLQVLLEEAEQVVGDNYVLTLVGRCRNEEIGFADILMTKEAELSLAKDVLEEFARREHV